MKPDETESNTVFGSNSLMRVSIVLVLTGIVWWGATLTADVNTIKSSLVQLNKIDSMTATMQTLSARLETLERRGSDPMQAMQKSLDKLAAEMQLHIITTETKKP